MSRSTADTGFIRLLGQWAVDDCGRVINPLLVDEQVRGGIVQGIGAVLFEECIYSEDANLLNGTMADYLVPMAYEMPDIVVGHVETPETSTELGAKGIGEAGLIGAMGAVWVAVNDALQAARRQDYAPAVHAGARARRSGTGQTPLNLRYGHDLRQNRGDIGFNTAEAGDAVPNRGFGHLANLAATRRSFSSNCGPSYRLSADGENRIRTVARP